MPEATKPTLPVRALLYDLARSQRAHLPHLQRVIETLAEFGYNRLDQSGAKLAEALQISEGTSKSQLSKARNLLQKMLEQNETGYAQRKSK